MRSPIVITATLILSLTSVFSYLPAQAQVARNSIPAKQFYEQGLKQFRNGQYSEARRAYQQVLFIESENGNDAGVGRALNSLGGLYYEQEQYYQALEVYVGSLAIRRQIKDRKAEARTLYNIGLVYQELGQKSQAQKSFNQAMVIFNQTKDATGIKATTEALSPTRPSLESGFSSGTILLDEYETDGLTPPISIFSNNPKIPTPLPRVIRPQQPSTPTPSGDLGPL